MTNSDWIATAGVATAILMGIPSWIAIKLQLNSIKAAKDVITKEQARPNARSEKPIRGVWVWFVVNVLAASTYFVWFAAAHGAPTRLEVAGLVVIAGILVAHASMFLLASLVFTMHRSGVDRDFMVLDLVKSLINALSENVEQVPQALPKAEEKPKPPPKGKTPK